MWALWCQYDGQRGNPSSNVSQTARSLCVYKRVERWPHLSEFLHLPVGQILEAHSVGEHLCLYPPHIFGVPEQFLESWQRQNACLFKVVLMLLCSLKSIQIPLKAMQRFYTSTTVWNLYNQEKNQCGFFGISNTIPSVYIKCLQNIINTASQTLTCVVTGEFTFHKSVVEQEKAGKSSFEKSFIFAIQPLEPGSDVSTNASSGFRWWVVSTQGQPADYNRDIK